MTKTLFFVLDVPRDQDCGLEDYITAELRNWEMLPEQNALTFGAPQFRYNMAWDKLRAAFVPNSQLGAFSHFDRMQACDRHDAVVCTALCLGIAYVSCGKKL